MPNVNIESLFLGPKSENQRFFKDILNFLMDEHIHWRRDFHPADKPIVTLTEQRAHSFEETLQRTTETLLELSAKLKTTSMPWFSARYLGHMNSDTLMVANLAYMATILYNPNNVAFEASPATTNFEVEVGKQLAAMIGFDPEKAWGHLPSDGTIANYEALWIARNLKSVPLAVKRTMPELVQGMSEWELLNLPTQQILELVDKAKRAKNGLERVRRYTVRGVGTQPAKLGCLIVPQSKHYSWCKAVDILGLGQDNLVSVPVGENFRMDLDELEQAIDRLTLKETPVLGVVAVIGTTEEGAVDEVHRVVQLRKECETRGLSFYLHIDAAYGGYACSIFRDQSGKFASNLDELKDKLHEQGILHKKIQWPSRDVYDAYHAVSEADSVTIDPHKMGYIPYSAGGIVHKDKGVLELVAYSAAYVFEELKQNPKLLGSYILEGSKAGAAAAAVWAAHRVLPLNMFGYGRLIGRSLEGANRFYDSLARSATKPFEIAGKKFIVAPLTKPDFNLVAFAFNQAGNTNLDSMNTLNSKIYEQCSYHSGPVYLEDFITSQTELDRDNYRDAPREFVEGLGIAKSEWDRVKRVRILRSCVLSPFLTSNITYSEYWNYFMSTMKNAIREIVLSDKTSVDLQ